MFPERYKQKLVTLKKIIFLVYKERPKQTFLRDLLFIAITTMEMFIISVGGFFIDATTDLLAEWNSFDLGAYFTTNSFYYLIVGLILWMLINLAGKIRSNLGENIDQHVLYKMQGDLLEEIADSNLQDVESKEFRDLLAYVPNFSYENIIATYNSFSKLIRNFVRAFASVIILSQTIGPSAFIVMLIPFPETYMAHVNRKARRKFDESEVERLKIIDYIQNITTRIAFFSELRVDGTFSKLVKTYAVECAKYMNGYLEKIKHFYIDTALFAQVGRVLITSYSVFILAISVAQRFTIGHFKALYDYSVTGYESAHTFLNEMFKISNYLEYSKKYFEYAEYKGFGEIEHGDKKLPKGTPKLEFSKLDFGYPGSEKKVLQDINLVIEPGEKVAIVGGDGAGKSSLIKVFCGLYEVTAGDYVIGEYSIRELDRGVLKKKISAVFQNFVNYNLSVKDNVTLADERGRIDKDLYKKSLKAAGVDQLLKREKVEDSQLLGKYFAKGVELSPGHWQRLAIARMLYRNRKIFIMDEAFTFIDGESKKKILKDVVEFIGPDRTLIFITHDLGRLKGFDRIYYLHEGRLYDKKPPKKRSKSKKK